MNEKLTPDSPDSPEKGEVEFNGFTARVRSVGPIRAGKFRVSITRKYPSTLMHEVYAWGTLMEARAFALGIMQTFALFEDLISDGAPLPLDIGERSGEDITPEKEG